MLLLLPALRVYTIYKELPRLGAEVVATVVAAAVTTVVLGH